MGRGSEQRIQLRRENPGTAWGFRLQGGKDFNVPLSVQRVSDQLMGNLIYFNSERTSDLVWFEGV